MKKELFDELIESVKEAGKIRRGEMKPARVTRVWKKIPWKVRVYPVILRPWDKKEGKGYNVYYPDLRGCVTDGETLMDAIAMAVECAVLWIDVLLEDGGVLPPPMTRVILMKGQMVFWAEVRPVHHTKQGLPPQVSVRIIA
jgi:predicted RNase H-like HicB family nuclease